MIVPFPEPVVGYVALLCAQDRYSRQRVKATQQPLVPAAVRMIGRCKICNQLVFVDLTRYSWILEDLGAIRGQDQTLPVAIVVELAGAGGVAGGKDAAAAAVPDDEGEISDQA